MRCRNADCEEHDCSPPQGYHEINLDEKIKCGPESADYYPNLNCEFTADSYWIPYQLGKLLTETERLRNTQKYSEVQSFANAVDQLVDVIQSTRCCSLASKSVEF